MDRARKTDFGLRIAEFREWLTVRDLIRSQSGLFMSLSSPPSLAIKGAHFRIGIAAARFNEPLVDRLLARVLDGLREAGVKDENIAVLRVPGSHEVPWAVNAFAVGGECDCVIALGVLIGGDTRHHEMVGESVSIALQRVAIDTGVPVINGVIVTDSLAQAKARCAGRINRAREFASAALEMATLRRKFLR
jgi:6,7-dimethyl-8-ribityllumazine synthase